MENSYCILRYPPKSRKAEAIRSRTMMNVAYNFMVERPRSLGNDDYRQLMDLLRSYGGDDFKLGSLITSVYADYNADVKANRLILGMAVMDTDKNSNR